MRRLFALALTTAVIGICALTAFSQPPEGKGPPGGPGGKRGGPPGFELGKVLPPFVREELDLTADQEKQIAALEAEVKQKLDKILTADQKKKIANARPPMGGPGGPGGGQGKNKGGFGGKDGPPKGGDKDGPPPKKDDGGEQANAGGGIQWFATLDAGIAEAQRTGRPILFLSAAPHCAGVSGIW